MTYEQIQDKLKDIIATYVGDTELKITNDTNLYHDLQFDSLSMIEIIIRTEQTFGINISETEIDSIQTFADLACIICDKKHIPHPQIQPHKPVKKPQIQKPQQQQIQNKYQNIKMKFMNLFKKQKNK